MCELLTERSTSLVAEFAQLILEMFVQRLC